MQRPAPQLEENLAHVRWLLGELPTWDNSVVTERVRKYLADRYFQDEQILRGALGRTAGEAAPEAAHPPVQGPSTGPGRTAGSTDDGGAPTPLSPSGVEGPSTSPGRTAGSTADGAGPHAPPSAGSTADGAGPHGPPPPPGSSRQRPPAEAAQPTSAWKRPPHDADVVGDVLEAAAPRRTADDRVVEEASSWSRFWKPFLSESVGWFVGAFLILAGIFYWVSSAWASMTTHTQALTVFGLAAGWTLAFAAWAGFLSRRETTLPAARVLRLIAAVVAPLATIAAGPALSAPLLFWPAVLGWSLVAAELARRVGREEDPEGATPLALAWGATTLVMGAAPLVKPLGEAAAWLTLLPVALAALAWRVGPRAEAKATRFTLLAMLYAVGLFGARVHVALFAAGQDPGFAVYAPMGSLLLAAVLWLRPPSSKAADALSVSAVALQAALLVPASFAPAPGFLLGAALASWTTARLALERRHPASARWLYPAYAFAYLAFQRLDQLATGFVQELLLALKLWLHYTSAPLPPSYASVYAALFVAVVGVWAAVRLERGDEVARREADVLLHCTGAAGLFFGGLSLLSLESDARPALVTTPALALLGLALGLGLGRRLLTASGTLLTGAAAAAWALQLHSPWPLGAAALALAALSLVTKEAQRVLVSAGAAHLVALGFLLGFAGQPSLGQVLTLAMGTAALALVVRDVESRAVQALAWVGPVLTALRLALWLWPGGVGVVLAALALGLALASTREGRLGAAWPVSVLAAGSAVLWQVGALAEPPSGAVWPGVVLSLAAAALLVGARAPSRRGETLASAVEGLGLLTALAALFPDERVWPFMDPTVGAACALALALGASVVAVRRERSWQGGLLATGAGLLAMVAAASELLSRHGDGRLLLVAAAVTWLAATPALVASVTVPAAALLIGAAWFDRAWAMVAAAAGFSLLALFEEWDLTWRYALHRSRVGWAGSASALGLFLGALAATFARLHLDVPLPLEVALVGAGWLLPLVWVRATRSALPAALCAVLPAAVALGLGAPWLFLPPVLTWALSRLVAHSQRVKALLGLRAAPQKSGPTPFSPSGVADTQPFGTSLVVGTLCAAAVASVPSLRGSELWVAWLWAACLAFMAGPLLPLRLAAAAGVAVLVPGAATPLAVALMAAALVLHHAPGLAERLFGATRLQYAAATAALTAVAVAAVPATVSGGVGAHALLATSLGVAALLLGVEQLLAAAVVVLGLDLHALAGGQLLLPAHALWVATAAAALAALLRVPSVASAVERGWARLGARPSGEVGAWVWAGALGLVALSLPASSLWWLAPAGLLLMTPRGAEVVGALVVFTLTLVVNLEPATVAGLLSVLGAALAWAGHLAREQHPVSRTWHHAGWALATAALAFGFPLSHPGTAVAWAFAAVAAWAVVARHPKLEWVGWGATLAAAHAVLGFLGLWLSTGAPRELILPWFALASALVGLVAGWRAGPAQRRAFSHLAGLLAVAEVVLGAAVIHGPDGREAVAAVLAVLVVCVTCFRQATRDDSALAAALGQLALAAGLVAARSIGLALHPGAFEAFAALVFGAVLGGLAGFLDREGRPTVARAFRAGALGWPLFGLVAAPWSEQWVTAVLLMAQAAHFAVFSRQGAVKGRAALLASAAFNAAMVMGWLASGFSSLQYLAVPFGLSCLALVRAFRHQLSALAQARLRAAAMAVIYMAVAWQPLTFDVPWALWLCVAVCVAGVAVGVGLRIRSFVYLGTGFLVTTVLANLVRYGVREPRVGALLLSALGLVVVAFMVTVSTRRAELLERYRSVQRVLAQWDG